MTDFLNFLIVITAGVLFSGLFTKVNIPYVTALIISGIVIGPHLLNIFVPDPTIEAIASIGVIFLMFMAGLEVNVKYKKYLTKRAWYLITLNSVIPFITGFLIGHFFGYSIMSSLVLGIVFISSSVAIVIPQLEKSGLIKREIGQDILTATVFEDIGSLLLLSMALQTLMPKTQLPMIAYYVILLISIIIMKLSLPTISKMYHKLVGDHDKFNRELLLFFSILVGAAIFFEALGVHSIVAGFIIGMLLSETVKHERLMVKIRTISYGLFIPTFFVLIGASLDLSTVFAGENYWFVGAVVLGLILSKVGSGYLAGRLTGYTKDEALLIGFATTPQLSTTLAAAFAALGFGLLTNATITALVTLSIVTTLLAPMAIKHFTTRIKKSERDLAVKREMRKVTKKRNQTKKTSFVKTRGKKKKQEYSKAVH